MQHVEPSLRLLSYLNVTVPLNERPLDQDASLRRRENNGGAFPLPTLTQSGAPVYDPADPTHVPDWNVIAREPFQWSEIWQYFTSLTWHYGRSGAGSGRGEDRVKADTFGFVSYYAPELKDLRRSAAEMERSTLKLTKEGYLTSNSNRTELARRRRRHTLAKLSLDDAAHLTNMMESALSNPACSGVDWNLRANSIAQRYTDSLIRFRNILSEWSNAIESTWREAARENAHSLLMPFFEYPADGASELHRSSHRGQAAYARCRYSWTRLLSADQGVQLNEHEALLKWAVEETLGGICSVVIKTCLAAEREWQTRSATPSNDQLEVQMSISDWVSEIEELIAWLGWTGDQVTCKRTCSWDERCVYSKLFSGKRS